MAPSAGVPDLGGEVPRAVWTSKLDAGWRRMMLALVFSRDRALQLEACLSSLFRHVRGADELQLHVLYSASSQGYLKQYDQLAHWFGGKATFVHEVRFRDSVLAALRPLRDAGATSTVRWVDRRLWRARAPAPAEPKDVEDCVLFLVDDTLFVRSFDLAASQSALQGHPDALGFSLRLGRNTTESYALAKPQALPAFQDAGDGILQYDWTRADGDFGYPLEVSSSVYRIGDLMPILSRLDFQDPNTLESKLSMQAKHFSRTRPALLCQDVSAAFSAPINRVQTVFENRSGSGPQWSTIQLAERFDQGLRIDVTQFDNFTPSACHQEVGLSFERRA